VGSGKSGTLLSGLGGFYKSNPDKIHEKAACPFFRDFLTIEGRRFSLHSAVKPEAIDIDLNPPRCLN
jgi:hypothetical protein